MPVYLLWIVGGCNNGKDYCDGCFTYFEDADKRGSWTTRDGHWKGFRYYIEAKPSPVIDIEPVQNTDWWDEPIPLDTPAPRGYAALSK